MGLTRPPDKAIALALGFFAALAVPELIGRKAELRRTYIGFGTASRRQIVVEPCAR
jgi:hypothetical protein